MYTNIWMRWYTFDLHILRCMYLWPTTSNGWQHEHLWKCSRKQFKLWKRWNMVHLANRKPIIVMFNCDTISVYCTNVYQCVWRHLYIKPQKVRENSTSTCTCRLHHYTEEKINLIHAEMPYLNGILFCQRKMQVKTSNKRKISLHLPWFI